MNNLNNQDNIIGYCINCKDPITLEEDYVKDKGKLYCTYCYKTINYIVEELNLE
jgi:hypothetical protein